jgi:hypothetical protein
MVSLSTAISSSSVGAIAPESLLIHHIQAHIRQGEKAKERATKNHQKSEDHFIAAGTYLTTLKVNYAPTWQAWESLLKIKVKLSVGRASELMQLADGRKDLRQIRDATAQRVRALRANQGASSLQSRCNEEKEIPDELIDEETYDLRVGARILIDGLLDHPTLVMATSMVINGERQNDFAAVSHAVADLYQALMRAGR